MNASHIANVPTRLSNPLHETREPASGRHPESTTPSSPIEISESASSRDDAPMSHGMLRRSSFATDFFSSAFIRCGGRVPMTPLTGPLRPAITTRSAAHSGAVTPPSAPRYTIPSSSTCTTMKPISSQCPSIITVRFAPRSSTQCRLPWMSMDGSRPVAAFSLLPSSIIPACSLPVGVGSDTSSLRNPTCSFESSISFSPLPFLFLRLPGGANIIPHPWFLMSRLSLCDIIVKNPPSALAAHGNVKEDKFQ